MARSDQDDKKIIELAEQFSKIFAEQRPPRRPEGSITAKEYAAALGLTIEGARYRLDKMVMRGVARSELVAGSRFFMLEDEP